ncbi:MAG: hypothetical protein L0207_07195 [Chlamydiae bacterium]|nr:hypothetical protein [Chlamydiota bacterium]
MSILFNNALNYQTSRHKLIGTQAMIDYREAKHDLKKIFFGTHSQKIFLLELAGKSYFPKLNKKIKEWQWKIGPRDDQYILHDPSTAIQKFIKCFNKLCKKSKYIEYRKYKKNFTKTVFEILDESTSPPRKYLDNLI